VVFNINVYAKASPVLLNSYLPNIHLKFAIKNSENSKSGVTNT
jgi:hypothetical protein